jgi:MoaD family protein
MNVRLLAGLRARAKMKSISVQLAPDARARDLLAAIRQQHPALAEYIVDANGQLLPGVLLLVNGRHTDFLQGLDTPLANGDDLVLMPPMAGG